MNKVIDRLGGFQDELQVDRSVALWTATFLGLSTFLILFLFEPFGQVVHGYSLIGLTRIFSYALVTGIAYAVMEALVLPYFLRLGFAQKNFAKFVWYGLVLLLIISLIYLCKNFWMDFAAFSWPDFLTMIYRVSSIGLIPVVILLVLGHKRQAMETDHRIVLKSTEVNAEQLRIAADQLIAILSEENYVLIVYRDNASSSKIQSKLLRNSLSTIANELSFPFIRIHRSSIVNLTHVESYSGNSQGLKLVIPELETPLKVSRGYLGQFNEAWNTLGSANS